MNSRTRLLLITALIIIVSFALIYTIRSDTYDSPFLTMIAQTPTPGIIIITETRAPTNTLHPNLQAIMTNHAATLTATITVTPTNSNNSENQNGVIVIPFFDLTIRIPFFDLTKN